MRRVHLLADVAREKEHASSGFNSGLAQDLRDNADNTSVNRTGGPAVIVQSIDEKAGFDRSRNKSLVDAKADGSM